MSYLFSIITICYNSEKTIEKTILSVKENSNNLAEYIIVDGGSTDQTLAIVNKYKDVVTKIVSEPDKGIADAFNKGIRMAQGKIIALINSDDILLEGTLEKIQEAYEEEIDVYYGNTLINNPYEGKKYLRNAADLEYFKYELPFVHQSSFVTKKAYDKYGLYSLEYKICMDYELLSKMYYSGAKFKYVDAVLSEFTYGGISYAAPFKTLKEDMSIAKKNGLKPIEAIVFEMKYALRIIIKRTLIKLKRKGR